MKFSSSIFLASGFGVGFMPIAPGTFGALLAAVIHWFFLRHLPDNLFIILVIAFTFLSVWISNLASKKIGESDPQNIVIDEMAGMFVTMIFQPADLSYLVGGFLLFRLFDIVKPFPAKWIEKNLRDGWGIVMDDIVAGIYANAGLWCLGFLLPNINIGL